MFKVFGPAVEDLYALLKSEPPEVPHGDVVDALVKLNPCDSPEGELCGLPHGYTFSTAYVNERVFRAGVHDFQCLPHYFFRGFGVTVIAML